LLAAAAPGPFVGNAKTATIEEEKTVLANTGYLTLTAALTDEGPS